jgi:hypothetical protein
MARSIRLEELTEVGSKAIENALAGHTWPERKVAITTGFEGDVATVEYVSPGERPEDGVVLARAQLERSTGAVISVETFLGARMVSHEQEQAYAEIDAEASRLAEGGAKPLPAHAKQVLAALHQHQTRLPVIARCPFCAELLRVEALGESAWRVDCPCGKCKDTFRGL